MNDTNSLRFLLHVSDFHLTDNKSAREYAEGALKNLAQKLQDKGIKVDYLIHTGDVIDSSDVFERVASELPFCSAFFKDEPDEHNPGSTIQKFDSDLFKKMASSEQKQEFDKHVRELVELRFGLATGIIQDFISDLNVAVGNVVICSGNHDVLRPFSIVDDSITCTQNGGDDWEYKCPQEVEDTFQPFESFLNSLYVANSQHRSKQDTPVTYCKLGNINVLMFNTNWINHKNQRPGYYCIRCDKVQSTLDKLISKADICGALNLVLAHKPIYEICERPRLPYKRYVETKFMSNLQKFIGDNGIYLCGDKHTRSIVRSSFHDIHHYIGGEPLLIPKAEKEAEVEYNLLEISSCKIGMERKIHLKYNHDSKWYCEIRPQDTVVSNLYKSSRKYISEHSLEIISRSKPFYTWDSLYQVILSWSSEERSKWISSVDDLFKAICKYRNYGSEDKPIDKENIFRYVLSRIQKKMENNKFNNVLNLRGEYDSGKSTFLGLLYIYLLYQYSIGEIDFIPAYFSLENNEMFAKIEAHSSYFHTAKLAFESFVKEIQIIADKEHQPVCYIIDGLDEQDSWSYSTEDSIGRGLLDVLATCRNTWYIMAFSQHRLPCFKNTMPVRKYNDTSDIMYFNPVDVRERDSKDRRFTSFIGSFLRLMRSLPESPESERVRKELGMVRRPDPPEINEEFVESVCSLVRKFRRLTIGPGFMYQNFNYIAATNYLNGTLQYEDTSVTDIYKYYIDRQDEVCLSKLGYGFVDYAPAMAYLFAYKGYTYERFMYLHEDSNPHYQHVLESIYANRDKIYRTFTLIKKDSDVREYLIALHYNKELRYYAEHPQAEIAEISILNEFITRNISVLVRKLWSDTNKFVIACNQLLRREDLSNYMLSMLIYCLAHMQMYKPIRDSLREKLRKKAEETLLKQYEKERLKDIPWEISGRDNTEKLKCFVDLSLLHTLIIYSLEDSEDSLALAKAMFLESRPNDEDSENNENDINKISGIISNGFCRYNRQYQMVYYGDLFINGEDRQRPLNPSDDVVGKGFDFHNCFNYLLVKLNSGDRYPLREFDMYTMLDIISSRLTDVEQHCSKVVTPGNTFFFREAFRDRANRVLVDARNIVNHYIDEIRLEEVRKNPTRYKFLNSMLSIITKHLGDSSKNLLDTYSTIAEEELISKDYKNPVS